ncbi:MAG: hypothetical protein IPP82_12915 [Xanthomonadales bacterium]|nr:hypothetical protein [Xanthomonadales bacterium]
MNIRSFLTAGVLLLSLSGFAQAAEKSAALYRLDLVISRNGELIGKPAIVVEAGAQAEVSVDDAKKPADAFRILVTASPVDGTVGDKESLKIDLGFFDKADGKWVERAAHSVTTVLGEPLSLAFPSKPGETAEKNYDLVVLTSHGKPGAPAAK